MKSNRDDIDINDPEFWQKWAKKADVDVDTLDTVSSCYVLQKSKGQASIIIKEELLSKILIDENLHW